MQHALFLPVFGALADPRVVARIAEEAEEAGWDGVFVWDHIAYRPPVTDIADPWITLAAMAAATSSIRLGPMITPVPRRRPVKLAREVATLDLLSGGRVTLGVGIGGDGTGELAATGELPDARARGVMLDEGLAVMRAAWSGERVQHHGEHYTADLVVRPTPVQSPLPVWVAARYGNARPLRRAAEHDGVFPIDLTLPEQLAEVVAAMPAPPFDVAFTMRDDSDPRPFEAVGATWWLRGFDPFTVSGAEVRGVLRAGPLR